MPTNTPDQGLTLPIDPDAADNPVAFASFVGGVEGRLVRRYLSIADRTARDTAPVENQLTGLADVDRIEVYDGTNYVSGFQRLIYASVRVAADQTVNNSAVLVNATNMVTTLPTTGTYQWRCELFFDSTTTEDIQFAFTWPGGGSSARWGGIGMLDTTAGGTAASVKNNTQNASGVATSYGGAGAGVTISGSLFGEVTLAGTGGNLQLQFAQAAAAVSNTVLRTRSRMHVWRVL